MGRSALKRSLLISFLAAVTGCATVCDRKCDLENMAQGMMQNSVDPGIRAAGFHLNEDINPEFKKAGGQAVDDMLPKKIQCVPVVDTLNKVVKCSGPVTRVIEPVKP